MSIRGWRAKYDAVLSGVVVFLIAFTLTFMFSAMNNRAGDTFADSLMANYDITVSQRGDTTVYTAMPMYTEK